MLAYTYIEQGKFELREKPIPMAVGRWAVVSMGGRRSMSGFLMRIEA